MLAKIFEYCVYSRLSEFVEHRNVIDQFQSGFRTGNSTETALIRVLDDVRKGIDDKKVSSPSN